jgi:hypothetical protein
MRAFACNAPVRGQEAAMAGWFALARLYLVLLAIFTVGRFLMFKVPYDRGHHYFSIMILTLFASFFYGAFGRRWLGFSIGRAALTAIGFGIASQVVIFVATLLSFALGMDTYFTNPRALNSPEVVPFARAMTIRLFGLVVNPLNAALAGALGWALGALLPAGGERTR